ncbi:hypothetical protein BSKO_08108 [Bryopsis sp. KO-2023]|nr:hypothetical protein BSKO_08108 [Bryopsis sp. KO-2023]
MTIPSGLAEQEALRNEPGGRGSELPPAGNDLILPKAHVEKKCVENRMLVAAPRSDVSHGGESTLHVNKSFRSPAKPRSDLFPISRAGLSSVRPDDRDAHDTSWKGGSDEFFNSSSQNSSVDLPSLCGPLAEVGVGWGEVTGERGGGAAVKCKAEFSEESKNPTAPSTWNRISSTLVQQEVKVLTSDQLIAAQAADIAVVDVRPLGEWEEEHIPGSINVQLYRQIEGWSAFKIARRMSFAAFGVFDGTEMNEEFLEEVADVASKEDPIILVCGMGGSLDKTSYFENGTPTRSLIAAYELVQNGYQDVRVHKGGVKGWEQEERQFYTMNYEEEEE